MKHGKLLDSILLGVALSLVSTAPELWAQDRDAVPVEGERLSHEATLARALNDLESEDLEMRVGAVMLLGKYRDDVAVEGVLMGLVDSEVRVRRAAVVALTEMIPNVPDAGLEPLLYAVGDDDVEIRRMVSSNLAVLVGPFQARRVGGVNLGFNRGLPMELKVLFAQRFLDDDVIVRRNMVKHYFTLGIELPKEVFKKLLQDTDDQVRLESLRLLINAGLEEVALEVGDVLLQDPQKEMRLLFAALLSAFSGEAVDAYVAALMKDVDPDVSMQARLSDFALHPKVATGWELIQVLEGGGMSLSQGKALIGMCARSTNKSRNFLLRLLQVDQAELRLEAVRYFCLDVDFQRDEDVVIKILNDPLERVRTQFMNMMLMKQDSLPGDVLQAIVSSPYPEVRRYVFRFTRLISDEDVEDIVFEMLIDDEPSIREDALNEVSRRNFPDRLDILRISLEDADAGVQRRAATMLLNVRSREEIDWLAKFVREHEGLSVSVYIRQQLQRRYQVQF